MAISIVTTDFTELPSFQNFLMARIKTFCKRRSINKSVHKFCRKKKSEISELWKLWQEYLRIFIYIYKIYSILILRQHHFYRQHPFNSNLIHITNGCKIFFIESCSYLNNLYWHPAVDTPGSVEHSFRDIWCNSCFLKVTYIFSIWMQWWIVLKCKDWIRALLSNDEKY